ncbi:WD repeat-containing protein 55 homolog [Eupeodes corollae]|uniref:WD repeat-containing protein 55 homolog n=1 Tax=Eupeodes corollae TaxID=290404 RepID=UPI00249238A3|nr:WD repeat-containing protein 55 homolog [Eupeodes corollae]
MHDFYKPATSDDSDDSLGLIEDDGPVVVADFASDSDDSIDISDDDDFDPDAVDSDDSDDDDDMVANANATAAGSSSGQNTAANNDDKPSGSTAIEEMNEDEEEDETVRAIIAAIKKPRTSPPEIKLDDFISDICFSPEDDIIAIATITGDVHLYRYANEQNTHLKTIEVHTKACRDVEFTEDGKFLLTGSKDKSIMITDMETEKLKQFYDEAHEDAVNKLIVIDENMFASGDDSGTVKLWDSRTKEAVFSLKEVEDSILSMLTNDAKKLLLVTSADGYLTTLNIAARKLFVQSEPYEEELTCMGTFRGDSKLIVGTSKGRLYTYNWGQFGYHSDMFPGVKSSMSVMIPVTDRIACVAGEEGILRAVHIAPFKTLGVVGQHSLPIESLDISNNGHLLASSSHNNDVRFWNVTYFEGFADIKYNQKHNAHRENRHNLPSSKYTNASDFFSDLAGGGDD